MIQKIKIPKNLQSKKSIISELKQSLMEVKAMKEGKIPKISLEEALRGR